MSLFKPYHTELDAIHIGCEKPHAYFIPYESREGALRGERAQSAFLKTLCGKWDFRFFDSPSKIEALDIADFDAMPADKIDVPRSWENTLRYDTPNYTNTEYPFPCEPPRVPEKNPCALYSRDFTLDAGQLRGKDAILTFEGVSSCFYVWVNDAFVGYSEVSHCTSEFNITSRLSAGKNTIKVLVLKFCAASYLEDQDMFRAAGIFREVYLLFRDKRRITDLFVRCALADDFSEAVFTVTFTGTLLKNATARLLAADGSDTGASALRAGKTVTFTLPDPLLWSSETPNLYTVYLENGHEHIAVRVGARKIEVRDRVVYINGKKVKARGVNRHDSDPVLGYATPVEHMLRDLAILKQNNVNMIRTSHYPNDPRFPELCDKYGFYLVDEADLETHGFNYIEKYGWDYLSDDPAWGAKYLDRAVRLVERDKNHPSVIVWSLGNESGLGCNLVKMSRWIRRRDDSRLLHYEGANSDYLAKHKDRRDLRGIVNTESYMYAPVPKLKAYLASESAAYPLFLCEYCHAMGNGPGDLAPYTDAILEDDRFFGGCIWEYCDHAALLEPDALHPKYGYGGSFGDTPNAGNFCMDGLVYPDRRLHTGMLEVREAYKPFRIEPVDKAAGVFRLRNLRNFTDTSDISLFWRIEVDGLVTDSGLLDGFTVPPEKQADFAIPLPAPLPAGAVTAVFEIRTKTAGALVPANHLIGQTQFVLRDDVTLPKPARAARAPLCTEGGETICVRVGETAYTFGRASGMLSRIEADGNTLLDRPISLALDRAPMDNDRYIKVKWNLLGIEAAETVCEGFCIVSQSKNRAVLAAKLLCSAKGQPLLRAKLTYTVRADGSIDFDLDARIPDRGIRYYPRLGVCFPLVGELENLRYFGYGPQESYIDKRLAARLGAFRTTVTANHEPYLRPQENGAHFGTSYAALTNAAGAGLVVTKQSAPFSFNASHFSVAALRGAAYEHDLVPEPTTYLTVDLWQSGCGSNSCGPVLDEAYQLKAGKHRFAFSLAPCFANELPLSQTD